MFDPTLPITDAAGKLSVPVFSVYHTFNFFGRSANLAFNLPYAVGNFQGNVNGTQQNVYRSGMMDLAFRLVGAGGSADPIRTFQVPAAAECQIKWNHNGAALETPAMQPACKPPPTGGPPLLSL